MRERSEIEDDRVIECLEGSDLKRGDAAVNGLLELEVLLDIRKLLYDIRENLVG